MKAKHCITVFLLTISSVCALGQDVELPQLLPASPEPSALVKAGVANVNMSTGAATASIPLYNIKIRDYTFPVSLSYSTQGLKVDEATSRVGYGWVLNATGMITRSVKGQPDELSSWLSVPGALPDNTDAVYNYLITATSGNSGFDTQRDEFQFNVNGYTGKFVLDTNMVPHVTSQQNVKISTTASISPIRLTTPDGVKYTFSSWETTTTHNVSGLSTYKDRTVTAFFLDRIDLPTGENIRFTYGSMHVKTSGGRSETLEKSLTIEVTNSCAPACPNGDLHTTSTTAVEYDTKYLTNITASNGLVINFGYEGRNDASGDNRLTSMVVSNLKNYSFEYYDVPSNGATSGRFFLTRVRDNGTDENADTAHNYVMTYDKMEETPLPMSFEQDYLGYYNGNGSNRLLPTAFNSSNTIDLTFRNPNWAYARKGTLKSIQYPTGGWEQFIYEPNTNGVIEYKKRNTMLDVYLDGVGGGSTGTVYSILLPPVKRNQTATLTAYADDAILDDGRTADPMAKTAYLYLYDITNNNAQVGGRTVLGYQQSTGTVSLVADHTYRLELKVMNTTEHGYGYITYDTASQDIYDNVYVETVVPGVRLKRIRYIDPVTLAVHSKYYTYETLDKPGQSTGETIIPDFRSTAEFKQYCSGSTLADQFSRCNKIMYSSNTTQDVYNYSGSGTPIYYRTVIESDDPAFKNGGIEYTFFENDNGANHDQMSGQSVPYLPSGQYPTLSGSVKTVRYFDKDKKVVKEEINEYEQLIDMSNAARSYYIRRRYDPMYQDGLRMNAFDITRMWYGTYWIRLKSKTTKEYVGTTVMTSQESYTYGAFSNILPVAVTNKDSKGKTLRTEKKYPTDFPTDANYRKLINKNLITPVVLETSYVNDTLFQQKKVIYKDWFGDSTIVTPEIVQVKEAPTDVLHNALLFQRYDRTGNPQLLRKADDMPVAYVWDTVHALPYCEVRNADFTQFAFTNFEAPVNYGNWQLTSGAVTGDANALSGTGIFSGTLSRSIAVAGDYKVNVWTKSTVTVNGVSGTLIRSNRGWNLYEWTLTNPSTVTIQGTNLDDARLLPVVSTLKSYTYQPFVGTTSHSNEQSELAYFQYDGYGRLATVRDKDYNITNQYSYFYAGSVKQVYFNAAQSKPFTRKNCTGNLIPETVIYTVPEDTYSSTVSQADADQQALNDIDANGQNYANTNGACLNPVTVTGENWTPYNNWIAIFINRSTDKKTTYIMPLKDSTKTLGVLPEGDYDIQVYSTDVVAIGLFISTCTSNAVPGNAATFTNVHVSQTACNNVIVSLP